MRGQSQKIIGTLKKPRQKTKQNKNKEVSISDRDTLSSQIQHSNSIRVQKRLEPGWGLVRTTERFKRMYTSTKTYKMRSYRLRVFFYFFFYFTPPIVVRKLKRPLVESLSSSSNVVTLLYIFVTSVGVTDLKTPVFVVS